MIKKQISLQDGLQWLAICLALVQAARLLFPQQAIWQSAGVQATGIGGLLIGLGCFVFGGLYFTAASLTESQSPQFAARREARKQTLSPAEARQADREILRALWTVWRPALHWLGLGMLLIVLSAPLT